MCGHFGYKIWVSIDPFLLPLPPTHIEVNWAACDGYKPEAFSLVVGEVWVCNPTMVVNASIQDFWHPAKSRFCLLRCVVGGGWLSFSLSLLLLLLFQVKYFRPKTSNKYVSSGIFRPKEETIRVFTMFLQRQGRKSSKTSLFTLF